MEGEVEEGGTAPWLRLLMSLNSFNRDCKLHWNLSDSKLRFFCVTCYESCGNEDLLCAKCSVDHDGHALLQSRRASYAEAFAERDIRPYVNLDNVVLYIVNGESIVFLKMRPQRKHQPAQMHCETCHRMLQESMADRFCSIQCKFEATKWDKSITMRRANPQLAPPVPLPAPPRKMKRGKKKGKGKNQIKKEEVEDSRAPENEERTRDRDGEGLEVGIGAPSRRKRVFDRPCHHQCEGHDNEEEEEEELQLTSRTTTSGIATKNAKVKRRCKQEHSSIRLQKVKQK